MREWGDAASLFTGDLGSPREAALFSLCQSLEQVFNHSAVDR